MSEKNIALVERFYELRNSQPRAPGKCWTSGCLAKAVDYVLVVAKSPPIQYTFCGQLEVESYLDFLLLDYQIVEAMPTDFTVIRNSVIARGGEVAHVIGMGNALVQTRWIAVYEIENELITKIWMSVHSWNVLVPGQDRTLRTIHRVLNAHTPTA